MEEAWNKWNKRIIFGGDFNARTASEGRLKIVEKKHVINMRKSKDPVYNKDDKELCRCLEERGWVISNGCVV